MGGDIGPGDRLLSISNFVSLDILVSLSLFGLTLVSGGTGNVSTWGWLIGIRISLMLIFII